MKLETYKNYHLPFKRGRCKDFRNNPQVVSGKRLTYVALELGIGSLYDYQRVKPQIKLEKIHNLGK